MRQLPNMRKDTLDQGTGSGIALYRNVVSDGIKIRQGRLGPNYFSHRAKRTSASAWLTVRPSETAISPRAIPSRTTIRCC